MFNILYITHTSSKYTGSNRSLLSLLQGLQDKTDVRAFVVLPKRKNMSLVEELEKLGVQYIVLKYSMPIYPAFDSMKDKLLFTPKLVKVLVQNCLSKIGLRSFLRQNEINLIHTNVGPMLMGYNLAKEFDIPHVWHLREFQDLDFNLNTFYSKDSFKRMLSADNNYCIAISESIAKYFDLDESFNVIYNGIYSRSSTQFIREKSNYFLYVGYLREAKGIGDLIHAYYKFADQYPDFKLLVAGDTTDLQYKIYLQNLLIEFGIQDKVQFLGQRDDISDLMAKARALIVPSHNEGFGRITVEAMFNGCFVIGKKSSGTKEIIEKIRVGMLYDSESELVEMMKQVASDSFSYDNDLESAIEKAVANFSIEGSTNSIYGLYKKIYVNRLQ